MYPELYYLSLLQSYNIILKFASLVKDVKNRAYKRGS